MTAQRPAFKRDPSDRFPVALGGKATVSPSFIRACGFPTKVEQFLLSVLIPSIEEKEPVFFHATDKEEAQKLRSFGFEAIECSFGEQSVGYFDHHGDRGGNPPVSVMAWDEKYFGSRKTCPWFVFTGAADADVVLAILLLLGEIPRDDRTRKIVDWVARLDRDFRLDPFGHDDIEPEIRLCIGYWNQKANVNGRVAGLKEGISLFKSLIDGQVPDSTLRDAHLLHQERNSLAALELQSHSEISRCLPRNLIRVVEYSAWAPWIWLREAPIILALNKEVGRLTLVGSSDAEMAHLFGSRGFMRIYRHLQPLGWGGSTSIGGPPRHFVGKATVSDAVRAAVRISSFLHNRGSNASF